MHTGRPVMYPQYAMCTSAPFVYVDEIETADKLRRLPTTWRLDLRAERTFELSGWQMRLFFEMQNATLTPEVVGYSFGRDVGHGPFSYHVVEDTVFIPLPLIGLEVTL